MAKMSRCSGIIAGAIAGFLMAVAFIIATGCAAPRYRQPSSTAGYNVPPCGLIPTAGVPCRLPAVAPNRVKERCEKRFGKGMCK